MGLETNVSTIRDLNQNWPPVGDPRAQGADHLRNIKKAIQLSFPNLKQCLLSDAQFTALAGLVGDGSGSTISYVPALGGTTDYKPTNLAVNKSGRYVWVGYKDDNGNGQFINLAPAGNYASKDDVAAESKSRSDADSTLQSNINQEQTWRENADTNLQNQINAQGPINTSLQDQINARVQKTGDTMSGGLTVQNWAGVVAKINPDSPSNGTFVNYPPFSSQADGRGGQLNIQLQEEVGVRFSSLMSLKGSSDDWRYWSMPQGSRCHDSAYGDFAYTQDLPFTDQKLRVQVWVKDGVNSNDIIGLPQGFSTLLGVIAQEITPWNRYMNMEPATVDADSFQGGQFKVLIWNGGQNRKILFTAFGYF